MSLVVSSRMIVSEIVTVEQQPSTVRSSNAQTKPTVAGLTPCHPTQHARGAQQRIGAGVHSCSQATVDRQSRQRSCPQAAGRCCNSPCVVQSAPWVRCLTHSPVSRPKQQPQMIPGTKSPEGTMMP